MTFEELEAETARQIELLRLEMQNSPQKNENFNWYKEQNGNGTENKLSQ